jgi:hypothetical protein
VAAALVAGLAGVMAAGCSSGSSGPGVASLAGQHASSDTVAAGTGQTSAQLDQDFVNFARCLRQHGVNEPDPFHRPGHSGLSVYVPTPSPATRPALAACNHFLAAVEAMKAAGARSELTRWLPSLVRYAACMRSHDIPMLDPGPQGQLNLGNVPGITSDFGRYSPQFRAADTACRHLLPRAVHDDGTGP